MPLFVVGKVRAALNRAQKSVNGSSILLLGVAYKRDIGDVRESPALDVLRLLEADGAEVAYHDPHVPHVNDDGRKLRSVPLTDEALSGADVVVILTDHSVFDYPRILDGAGALVDARNATAGISGEGEDRWIVKM